jgi:hypothetical protein
MTKRFDQFCEAVITEFITAKSKRKESRYWKPTLVPKSDKPRAVQTSNNITASQKTKQGYQQYVGNALLDKGIRGQNKSQKSTAEVAISKGLGAHLRRDGVNPRKPGSRINSKQGNMVVKYNLSNGVAKIGSAHTTDFEPTEKPFTNEMQKKLH